MLAPFHSVGGNCLHLIIITGNDLFSNARLICYFVCLEDVWGIFRWYYNHALTLIDIGVFNIGTFYGRLKPYSTGDLIYQDFWDGDYLNLVISMKEDESRNCSFLYFFLACSIPAMINVHLWGLTWTFMNSNFCPSWAKSEYANLYISTHIAEED